MGEFDRFILSGQTEATQINPDLLKLAGKRAAASYLSNEEATSLTDEVAKEAAQLEGVQPAHVARICEAANQEAHDALFQKEAAAKDGHVIYVQFNVANPGEVVAKLDAGTKVANIQLTGEQHYGLPPGAVFSDDEVLEQIFEKNADMAGPGTAVFSHPVVNRGTVIDSGQNLDGTLSKEVPEPAVVAPKVSGQKEKVLRDPSLSTFDFEVPDSAINKQDPMLPSWDSPMPGAGLDLPNNHPGSKQASADIPFENPHHDILALRTELEDNHRAVSAQAEQMHVMAEDAWEEFYTHTKQAMLDEEATFDKIASACLSVCEGNARVFQATIGALTDRLLREDIASVNALDRGIEKAAAVDNVNPESPLVKAYAGFLTLLGERTKIAGIATELSDGIEQIDEYIRRAVAPAGA